MSVRGLFEEIKQLKKENLDLKLKIYFLEDSNSQSNRIKELIDHNVKLKIEVEESKNEVDRKKLLIEETISILDEQQSKLDEYERKFKVLGRKSDYFKSGVLINFLEQTCAPPTLRPRPPLITCMISSSSCIINFERKYFL